MSTKQHTRDSLDGLLGCILLVALLVTSILALVIGSFVTEGNKNPIENLMLAIRDGFTTEADDLEDDEEDAWGDEWDDDKWGDNFDDTTSSDDAATVTTPPSSDTSEEVLVTDPPRETHSDETDPPVPDTEENGDPVDTDAPSVTDPITDEEPVTTPPESTSAPVTEPPVTVPPITEPPATKPPVTEPPIANPDRVNDPDYFDDALFIGDSRTVGLATYGKISGATYFARTSMNVNNIFADKKSETERSGLNLEDFLKTYSFKKIYILLGINEIGYEYSWIMKRYEALVNKIRALQPDAIIILQSNMHVTQKKSDANPDSFNNKRINELNKRIASLADNKTVFYADMTYIFDDKNGALNPEYTGDGVHLKGKYYALWRDWLLEKGKR